jgi:broad specificity phosphatase PhoE
MKKSVAALLIRHGEAEGQHEIIKGMSDEPLDDKGHREAEQLGPQIARYKPTVVLTSPLQRARIPAEHIAKQSGVPLHVDESFLPWNLGQLTGQPKEQGEQKLKHFAFEEPDTPVPGGESFNSFLQRAGQGFKTVADLIGSGERPAVVTHSRNLREAGHFLYGEAPSDPTVGGPDPAEFYVLDDQGKLSDGSENKAQDETYSSGADNGPHPTARKGRRK